MCHETMTAFPLDVAEFIDCKSIAQRLCIVSFQHRRMQINAAPFSLVLFHLGHEGAGIMGVKSEIGQR